MIKFSRLLDLELHWKFKYVTQRSTSNLAEILMRRTSLHVKLQHDAGNVWGIIIFTRSYCVHKATWQWANHEELQDAIIWTWPSSKDPKWTKIQNEQTSKSNSSNILICKVTTWCMKLLRSWRVHKATWPWASLKVQKGHIKVNIELIQDVYVENTTIKLQLDTGNLRRVIIFTRSF